MGIYLLEASPENVAAGIIRLFSYSAAQARNAYSAVLLLFQLASLRFLSILQPYKRQWNKSVSRYGTFWDSAPLVQQLAGLPVPGLNTLRNQLLIAIKLFC